MLILLASRKDRLTILFYDSLVGNFEVGSEVTVREQGSKLFDSYLALGAQRHVIFGRFFQICILSVTVAGLIVLAPFNCVMLGGRNADDDIFVAPFVCGANFLERVNKKRSFTSPFEDRIFLVFLLRIHGDRRRQSHHICD